MGVFLCAPALAEDKMTIPVLPPKAVPGGSVFQTRDGKTIMHPPVVISTDREVLVPPPPEPVVITSPNGYTKSIVSDPLPLSKAEQARQAAMRQVIAGYLIQSERAAERNMGPLKAIPKALSVRSIVVDKEGRVVVGIVQAVPGNPLMTGQLSFTRFDEKTLVLPKEVTAQAIKDAAADVLEKQAAALEEAARKMRKEADDLSDKARELKAGR